MFFVEFNSLSWYSPLILLAIFSLRNAWHYSRLFLFRNFLLNSFLFLQFICRLHQPPPPPPKNTLSPTTKAHSKGQLGRNKISFFFFSSSRKSGSFYFLFFSSSLSLSLTLSVPSTFPPNHLLGQPFWALTFKTWPGNNATSTTLSKSFLRRKIFANMTFFHFSD